jgi:predicted membrane protein
MIMLMLMLFIIFITIDHWFINEKWIILMLLHYKIYDDKKLNAVKQCLAFFCLMNPVLYLLSSTWTHLAISTITDEDYEEDYHNEY